MERDLSAYYSEEKSKNQQIFLKILRNIRFLARQGLALRGSIGEENNFIQLLKLEGEEDSQIEKWLKKKSAKYAHPEIQNEYSVYYTIMADEVTDSSNKEQFVVCLRWGDHDLVTHEELVGLYAVDNITSETLVNSLTLSHLGGGADSAPWETFLNNSKTAQDIKMKFSKFNPTLMGVILHIMTILINLRCCHGNLLL